MSIWRACLAITLCLLLGLTGQAQAFARGQAPAEGKVLICFGHLSKTVYVDADGQPTSPPELCGDCLNILTAAPLAGFALAAPLRFEAALQAAAHVPARPEGPARIYPARAPPVLPI